MPSEEIIVLANSDKPGGRCVAGISTESGVWIRPVTARASTRALSPADCSVGERMVAELDVVRFGYAERLEDPAQPENVLIDGGDWVLVDRIAPEAAYGLLRRHLTVGPELLGGLGTGVEDEVAMEGVDASLALVEPDDIRFASLDPYTPGRRRKARAWFGLASARYDLGITDAIVAPEVRSAETGAYSAAELGFPDLPHTVLTVSLAEPLNGTRYKLAAAVLFLP